MKKNLLIFAGVLIIAGALFVFPLFQLSQAATVSCAANSPCIAPDICYYPNTSQAYCALPVGGSGSCSYGCCSNSNCSTGETCYNANTQFAYCALPAAGTSSSVTPTSTSATVTTSASASATSSAAIPACAFPTNGFNQAGNAAIQVACQSMFGAQYNACKAAGKGLDCSYGDPAQQSLAFNCGMGGAGMGGPGYCLPGVTPPGCITPMTEAQLAAAVGASCSSVSTPPATTTTPPPTTTPPSTTATTNPIKGLQGYNPATGIYTNGTALQNTYIILYGNFGATGDEVTIDGTLVPPSYQSVGQINVPITGIAVGSHSVSVTTLLVPSPETGSMSFTVTASSGSQSQSQSNALQSETSFEAILNAGSQTISQEKQNFYPSGTGSTNSPSSSVCSSSAALNTIASLIPILQSAAGVLSSNTLSPTILASVQSLITTINQTLPSLTSCIAGNGASM